MKERTILVVDDNKTNLQTIRNILETSDYTVLLALNGNTALKFLEKKETDLVLLDLMMPVMDGKETFAKIRENPDYAHIPIIFLTADTNEYTESTCLELGAADFITKPVVPLVLLSRIEKTLELEDYHRNLEARIDEKAHEAELLTLQSIEAIAHTIDAKDENTNGHSRRVARYSRAIASRMGFNEDDVETITRSALLHDVGKIGIPDAVLKKSGRLTDEEYDTIKQHTLIGSDILSVITTFEHIPDGARSHHEHFDGSGYPDGLSGKDIPITGRIVAVADVYDALTSKRHYREAAEKEVVVRELERNAGSQFDPDVVKAFVQLLSEGLDIGREEN